jgi:hypothetical protein
MPLAHIRELASRLTTAATIDEALEEAVATAFVLLRPSFAAVSNRFVGEMMFASARVGPYANYVHRPIRLAAGWASRCEQLCEIPRCDLTCPAEPECFPSLRPRSVLLANVHADGEPIANVGISWTSAHVHDRYEREVLMTIASLLDQRLTNVSR